jgi:hypothetical protein
MCVQLPSSSCAKHFKLKQPFVSDYLSTFSLPRINGAAMGEIEESARKMCVKVLAEAKVPKGCLGVLATTGLLYNRICGRLSEETSSLVGSYAYSHQLIEGVSRCNEETLRKLFHLRVLPFSRLGLSPTSHRDAYCKSMLKPLVLEVGGSSLQEILREMCLSANLYSQAELLRLKQECAAQKKEEKSAALEQKMKAKEEAKKKAAEVKEVERLKFAGHVRLESIGENSAVKYGQAHGGFRMSVNGDLEQFPELAFELTMRALRCDLTYFQHCLPSRDVIKPTLDSNKGYGWMKDYKQAQKMVVKDGGVGYYVNFDLGNLAPLFDEKDLKRRFETVRVHVVMGKENYANAFFQSDN